MVSFWPIDYWDGRLGKFNYEYKLSFLNRFKKKGFSFFPTGKDCISWLLQEIGVQKSDEIFITTTFEYPNVSSCVTNTIFNYCKPSRVLSTNTKAIFVIHEFGVTHPGIFNYVKIAHERGIPLIEDCAHTIDSYIEDRVAGSFGDWTIISLPKVFPVRQGGALLGPDIDYEPDSYHRKLIKYLNETVGYFIDDVSKFTASRRDIFVKLSKISMTLGFDYAYELQENMSPWFFPIKTAKWRELMDLADEMEIANGHWRGTDIVVFPCHQYLLERDLRAFELMLKKFGE